MLDIEMNEAAAIEHHEALAAGETAKSKGVNVAMYAASFTTVDALKAAYTAQGQSEDTAISWFDSGKAYRALFDRDPEFWAKEENARLVRRRFTTSSKGKAFMDPKKGTPLSGKGLATAIKKAAATIDPAKPDNTEIVDMLKAGFGKEPGQDSRWLQQCRAKCDKAADDDATRDELMAALDMIGAALGDNSAYAELVAGFGIAN